MQDNAMQDNMNQDTPMSRQASHLLKHLAMEGAFVRRDPAKPDAVALYHVRRGITLGAGMAPRSCADELAAAGYAAWSDESRSRMRISARGQSWLQGNPGLAATGTVPPDSLAKRDIEITHTDTGAAQANTAESPLLWLHRRKDSSGRRLISDAAFAAGERLRADLTLSGTLPRVTSNWSAAIALGPRDNGANLNASEAMVAAGQRVQAAARAVGPEFSGLLIDVCGFLKGLELVERERRWPPRSAKLLLVMGLERLAAHYGLSGGAAGRVRRRTSVWQAADARPSGLA